MEEAEECLEEPIEMEKESFGMRERLLLYK